MRLLTRERFPGPAFAAIEAALTVCEIGGPLRPAVLAGGLDAEAVWTFGERIDGAFVDALPSLRAVANHGVGLDGIDRELLSARGIALIAPFGVNAEAVADHVFALLLALRRRIVELDAEVRRGGFERREGTDLHGSTLGIVGFGAIGRAVARRAQGFAMEVLICTRTVVPTPEQAALGVRSAPLDELLAASDAVALCAPLTPATERLIDAAALGRMRAGAVLINAARGGLVDEPALIEALRSGRLAGAGLDVFADEPRVPAELRGLPQVVLTPHAADETRETQAAITAAIAGPLLGALGLPGEERLSRRA